MSTTNIRLYVFYLCLKESAIKKKFQKLFHIVGIEK